MDARLQGCRAFGKLSRAVVERRLPAAGRSGTAAEVVPIPLLWRGARQGGVVEPRRKQATEVVEPCLERRPRNPGVRQAQSSRGLDNPFPPGGGMPVTCIHAGESMQDENVISILFQNQ